MTFKASCTIQLFVNIFVAFQVSKDKAKYEIEAEKATRESREAKNELAAKEKLLAATDRELKSLQGKYNDALTRANNAESELKTLKPENVKLKDKLEDAKRNLEDETLKRVELQNQLMSLEESGKFEKTMLEKQLNETRWDYNWIAFLLT